MLGAVWTDDPPLDEAGMTLVSLNPLGRLTQLIAVPVQVENSANAALPPDWAPLFSAAELDPSQWRPAQPIWTPPVSSDVRAAWIGFLAERPDIPMRIEAAVYRGKPVYFQVIGPWNRTESRHPDQPTVGERVSLAVIIVVFFSLLLSGALLARRNLRQGRGDRRGAFRLAAFVFAGWAVAWLFGAHHVSSFSEFALSMEALVWGLAWSSFSWLLYNALEPYVRRRWPATLVSWSRLLAGDFRDPLVGRDVLAGCLSGASTVVLGRVVWFIPSWLGYPPTQPHSGPEWQFLGARSIISDVSITLIGAPIFWLAGLFFLALLRALLRKDWLAALAFICLNVFVTVAAGQPAADVLVGGLIVSGLAVFLMTRFGFLTIVTNFVFWRVLETFPLTTQGSAWYAGISLAGILLMAAIAFCAFFTSLGERPAFGGAMLEE